MAQCLPDLHTSLVQTGAKLKRIFDTARAITMVFHGGTSVQLHKDTHNMDQIQHFDFPVCRVLFDGNTLMLHITAAQAYLQRTFKFSERSDWYRAIKYSIFGFWILDAPDEARHAADYVNFLKGDSEVPWTYDEGFGTSQSCEMSLVQFATLVHKRKALDQPQRQPKRRACE